MNLCPILKSNSSFKNWLVQASVFPSRIKCTGLHWDTAEHRKKEPDSNSAFSGEETDFEGSSVTGLEQSCTKFMVNSSAWEKEYILH